MKIKTSVFLIKQNFPFNGHTKKQNTHTQLTHRQTGQLASAAWGVLLLTSWLSLAKRYKFTHKLFYHDAFPFVHYFKKQSTEHCPVSRKTLRNSNGRFKEGGGDVLERGCWESKHSDSINYSPFFKHYHLCQRVSAISIKCTNVFLCTDIDIQSYLKAKTKKPHDPVHSGCSLCWALPKK